MKLSFYTFATKKYKEENSQDQFHCAILWYNIDKTLSSLVGLT